MPVRVKQRTLEFANEKHCEKQLASLRKQIVGLLLAWGRPIDICMNTSEGQRKMYVKVRHSLARQLNDIHDHSPKLNINLVRSLLSQSTYIDPSDWSTWVKVSARTSSITVEGAISLQPAPSRQIQFVSIGIYPINLGVYGNIIYDEVNRLFALSTFGELEYSPNLDGNEVSKVDQRQMRNGHTVKKTPGGGKGIDRWPMFYIRITTSTPEDVTPRFTSTEQPHQDQSRLLAITKIIAAMINGFLEDHHFQHRPKAPAKRHLYQPSLNAVISQTMTPTADDPATCKRRVVGVLAIQPGRAQN